MRGVGSGSYGHGLPVGQRRQQDFHPAFSRVDMIIVTKLKDASHLNGCVCRIQGPLTNTRFLCQVIPRAGPAVHVYIKPENLNAQTKAQCIPHTSSATTLPMPLDGVDRRSCSNGSGNADFWPQGEESAEKKAAASLRAQRGAASLAEPKGAISYVRCYNCDEPVPPKSAKVCLGCLCFCYCGTECQAKDALHILDCARHAHHATCDVSDHLPTKLWGETVNSEWLRTALHHHGDVSFCELLSRVGVHGVPGNEAHKLLCGCTRPLSPHRYLIEPPEGSPALGTRTLRSWAEYYQARELENSSPAALLRNFPLTL